jgi:putative toxin-antitoxin system antitoxin component (TIGR02293 family)
MARSSPPKPPRQARVAHPAAVTELAEPRLAYRVRDKRGLDVFNFPQVYRSAGHERVQLIKAGIPAKDVFAFALLFGVSQDEFVRHLGLSKSTVSRKIKADETLSADQGERLLGVAKLAGQVQTLVEESGDAAGFDAKAWLTGWLAQPNPALGGACPWSYMDTMEGQEVLATLIAQMQSGAYA